MRKIIMMLLVTVFMLGCVMNPYTIEPRKISIVSNVEKMDKASIFNKIKKWLAITFVSSKAVMDYESIDEGVITSNIIISSTEKFGYPSNLHLKVMFTCKDDKYKLDVLSVGNSYDGCTVSEYSDCSTQYKFWSRIDDVNGKYEALINELNKSIIKFISNEQTEKDNW